MVRSILGVICVLLCAIPVGAQGGLTLEAVSQGQVIVRDTPSGKERLVYLALHNPTPVQADHLTLRCTVGDKTVEREMLTVPPGESWDTVWLPEPVPARVETTLERQGTKILNGTMSLSEEEDERVTIPRSSPIQLEDLKPLMLRGTNYLPRRTPWSGTWREATRQVYDAEFRVMNGLRMNTFRTFYFFDEERGLVRRDGTVTPELLSRINTLLDVADAHKLKVVFCLTGNFPHPRELDTWRRFFRTGIEPFAHDGRVLMWDLINEPGGPEGPKASPELTNWIQTMYPELERLAPDHLRTVGLCWQFDQLWDLGVKPPVGQYHEYSGAVGVQPAGQPAVRNIADDLKRTNAFIGGRPLIIGEFGYPTQPDEARKDAGEERQKAIYEDVIAGVEATPIAGVYNWTLFHFEPDWMGRSEQSFGIVRLDGSLKPAGELLKTAYARWQERVRAPWE